MTALEEQLTAALKRLSAQYETEQRRHSGQVESLRWHVERQSGKNEALRQHVERQTAENEALQRRIERLDSGRPYLATVTGAARARSINQPKSYFASFALSVRMRSLRLVAV